MKDVYERAKTVVNRLAVILAVLVLLMIIADRYEADRSRDKDTASAAAYETENA